MQALIIAIVAYGLILPTAIFIVAKIYKYFAITRPVKRAKRKKERIDFNALPKPLFPKIKKRLAFVVKDKRGLSLTKSKQTKLQTRWVFWGIYVAGFITAIVASQLLSWRVALVALALGLITLWFGYQAADKAIKKRERIIDRMTKMASRHFRNDPTVQITKWADYTTPEYVVISIDGTFDDGPQVNFMYDFNKSYGQIRSWVPDPNAEGTEGSGWDHEEGVVYLKSKPPLPQRADWREEWLLNDGIAWSFFPIALGLEDGVEMPHPDTGETVNVLGFDLSGKQEKVGKAAGFRVSPKITTTPQVFIGGATGGGKAHPIETEVVVR